ncbi:MAG: Uma2 family endonuclease [Cyanobacteria bacterium CRU_2_1]|nr:Uma2 family endonuclease [Cyanobacteria bacterium CRU_2_1]
MAPESAGDEVEVFIVLPEKPIVPSLSAIDIINQPREHQKLFRTPEEVDQYLRAERAVTCDDRDRVSNEDFILHPKLIVEVLSDSTEAFDRGDKFADYKTIADVEEYVLIHQKQILVERFQRKSDNLWVPQIYRAGDLIEFASISFSCAIATLYENIEQLL